MGRACRQEESFMQTHDRFSEAQDDGRKWKEQDEFSFNLGEELLLEFCLLIRANYLRLLQYHLNL